MSDLGIVSYFLGLEVKQTETWLQISQQKYVTDLLKEYNMLHCKPVNVPLLPSAQQQLYEDTEGVDVTMYRKLIRKLIYVTQSSQILLLLSACYLDSCISLPKFIKELQSMF